MRRSGPARYRFAGAVCAAAILLGCACAPFAPAAYEPAGSGATRLELSKGFISLLRKNGVKLGVAEGARKGDAGLVLPVSGGKVDPASSRGTILHGGVITVSRGRRSFRIKDLMVKTTRRRSPLAAKVGGGQIKLFTAGGLTVRRTGFGVAIRSVDLRMTANLAVRLDHKLGLNRVFAEGLPVGTAFTKVDPALAALDRSGRLSLDLDQGLVAKLNQLFVAANPIHPAEHPGPFTFPIFGGQLSPQLTGGVMQDEGALELLQLGGGQVFWAEPWVDLDSGSLSMEADVEPSPPYRGKIGRVSVASLDLSAASVAARPAQRNIEMAGGRLALSSEAATELNEAFAGGKPVFAAGEPMGTLAFTAEGS